MKGLWLPNIKRFLAGTLIGGSPCLNVNVLNTVPVPTAAANYAYKEHRFMDASVTTINKSSGAWVQVGDTPADIANTIVEMRVNANLGAALQFGSGPNAGSVTVIGTTGAGQTTAFGVTLAAGDKIWVKAIQDNDVVAGELLVNLMG